MRRPVRVGIILAEVVAGLALARLLGPKHVAKLSERVRAKFSARGSQEQMESLLGRCHGLLETTSVRQRVARTTARVA